ncbi:MAG: 50S ribosomal protein L23 [Planctomycetota bacterium]|nr:50S ribosomal protein L23 [Planctomycetota bacterium]
MQKTDAYRIVLKPVLTEKASWEQENRNLYRFEVAQGTNKIEIARAIETLFDVKVNQVRTQNRIGKIRRKGAMFARTPVRKFALVTLSEGKIDLL